MPNLLPDKHLRRVFGMDLGEISRPNFNIYNNLEIGVDFPPEFRILYSMRLDIRTPKNDQKTGLSALFSKSYDGFSKNLKKNELFLSKPCYNFNKNTDLQTLVSGCAPTGYRLTNGR